MFIEIIDSPTFPYRPKHPDTGEPFESSFTLRVIPDDTEAAFRKKHTKVEWRRGVRHDVLQPGPYMDDCLDYAICDWQDVYAVTLTRDGTVASREALPCTRATKTKLPDPLKAEIIRICLGKEQDRAVTAGPDSDDADDTPDTPAALEAAKNG